MSILKPWCNPAWCPLAFAAQGMVCSFSDYARSRMHMARGFIKISQLTSEEHARSVIQDLHDITQEQINQVVEDAFELMEEEGRSFPA